MAAGNYGYAHSAINSENFPARHFGGPRQREVALFEFGREVTATDATTVAARQGLGPPTYEDALYFGIAYPDVQCPGPVIFLHDPWLGYFGPLRLRRPLESLRLARRVQMRGGARRSQVRRTPVR